MATDGSRDAALATRAAVDISQGIGSELHVVHVWRVVTSAYLEAFLRPQFEREAKELLEAQVERITADVGSRGLGAVQRLRIGSISTKVLHAAEGPVLVCPRS